MRLVSRRGDEVGGIDLDKALIGEPCPECGLDAVARQKDRAPVGMGVRVPPCHVWPSRPRCGNACRQTKGSGGVMKVIASQLRKGNVVESERRALRHPEGGKNFHPGKGTPVTQVDMRRISDGVKVSERWKTTDGVERAHVEEKRPTSSSTRTAKATISWSRRATNRSRRAPRSSATRRSGCRTA